jgi:hypothetical protein
VGRVFLVRRLSDQNEGDIAAILRRLEYEHLAAGTKLFYVALVKADKKLPEPEERAAIEKATPKILEHCVSIEVVIEGTGILVGLMRAMVRTMMVMASRYERVHVHATLPAALVSLGTQLDASPDTILRAAREAGIIT